VGCAARGVTRPSPVPDWAADSDPLTAQPPPCATVPFKSRVLRLLQQRRSGTHRCSQSTASSTHSSGHVPEPPRAQVGQGRGATPHTHLPSELGGNYPTVER
jgi:hypothetical protein